MLSYTATLASEAIANLFGTALAVSQTSARGTPLPDQLSDLRVLVNGIAALLYYVSPAQVNFQVPFEGISGLGGDSDCFRSRYDDPAGAGCANAPGMFTLNSQGTAAGAIEHSISYELVAETNPAGAGEIIPI